MYLAHCAFCFLIKNSLWPAWTLPWRRALNIDLHILISNSIFNKPFEPNKENIINFQFFLRGVCNFCGIKFAALPWTEYINVKSGALNSYKLAAKYHTDVVWYRVPTTHNDRPTICQVSQRRVGNTGLTRTRLRDDHSIDTQRMMQHGTELMSVNTLHASDWTWITIHHATAVGFKSLPSWFAISN